LSFSACKETCPALPARFGHADDRDRTRAAGFGNGLRTGARTKASGHLFRVPVGCPHQQVLAVIKRDVTDAKKIPALPAAGQFIFTGRQPRTLEWREVSGKGTV